MILYILHLYSKIIKNQINTREEGGPPSTRGRIKHLSASDVSRRCLWRVGKCEKEKICCYLNEGRSNGGEDVLARTREYILLILRKRA